MVTRTGRLAAAVAATVFLAAPAFAQTFAYRKAITINGGAGGLSGGPHLAFPLLVSLPNDASLLLRVASGGKDILFRGEDAATCGGPLTCVLPHEIERYDTATGTLVAWVRVPSVDVGTVIYMYYGNAQVAGPTDTPASVWSAGYVGVWHLKETGSGALREFRDSSPFANHGRGGRGAAAAVPTPVAGQMGLAQSFGNGDGTYDFVDVGDDGSLNVTGPAITMQAWVRHNIVKDVQHGTPPGPGIPYGILAHKGWDTGYSLWLHGEDFQCPGSAANPCAITNLPGRSYSARTDMATGPAAGGWHQVVGSYDGANVNTYVDGVLQASVPKTGNVAPSTGEAEVFIGQGDLPENVSWSGQFEGEIDEVRISNVARSADWILTEYRNQLAPAAFYAVGGETPVAQALPTYAVNLRSIGTAGPYVAGSVNATLGSATVDGVGTLWRTNNRGRGDRVTINAVDYTILSVDSETRLTLTSPFTSPTNNYAYTIARKFNSVQSWENCISGGACAGVSSVSLVQDNRSEVGVYYYDGSNEVGSPVVTFDGSITDAGHTVTLTVDPGNRHPGRGGGSPTWAALGNGGASATVRIYDDYVTVEWLELRMWSGSSTSAHGIEINNLTAGANHVVVRNNVIHTTGSGVLISDPDAVVDVYNNVIYATNYGIRLPGVDFTPAARLNVFNNTIYGSTGGTGPSGIKATVRQTTQRIGLRNNIVHSNNTGDIGVSPPFDRVWFYGGAYTNVTAQAADSTLNATLNFTNVGTDCLYVGSQFPFRGVAYDSQTGASGGMDLQWSYWNGAWTSLETPAFSDSTNNFVFNGHVYWSDDPAGWVQNTVSDATPLYYVRGCLAAGPPATKPVETQISRSDVSVSSTANLTLDMTGLPSSPRAGFAAGQNGVALGSVAFVNTTAGSENLHLQAGSAALDVARTLDYYFPYDIDATIRPVGAWDVGADEYNGTTEVRLLSFTATAGDASAVLEWRTASELDNLGFHLYRALGENGPWTRVTASLVPGLGSSPTGQAYSFRDAGLANGTRYYYRLDDVDARSRATSHGPVSVVPQGDVGGAGRPGGGGGGRGDAGASCPDWVVSAYAGMAGADTRAAALRCTRHGDPEAVSLAVVSRDARSATVELRTGGFYALHEASGRVRVFVPGFDFPPNEAAAALPARRALVDAVVGRRVELGGVRALEQASFPGLVPSGVGKAEMELSRDGTVRAGRRAPRAFAPRELAADLVRLLPPVFQGEAKSAVVEIAPLRFDARRRRLLLARVVRLRLLFTGREAGESGRGSVGRRPSRPKAAPGEVLARLYTTSRGLYAVSFERLFPGRRRGLLASELRLERQGAANAFHLEPASSSFGPGGVLYFHAETEASSTDFSPETAFELVRSRAGVTMPVASAAPGGAATAAAPRGFASFEANRFYQPGLLDAPDPWLWENLASGATRTKSFLLVGVDPAAGAGQLDVLVQGASESGAAVDHHLSVALDGVPLGEARFAGKRPWRITLPVPAALLRAGANDLALTNVADTGATSYVFLDRFALEFPQLASLAGGVFEGAWSEAGTATLAGATGPVALLDLAADGARWLTGFDSTGGAVRFHAEAGHRYLAVSQASLLVPRVAAPAASGLRSAANQADYLLIAPRAFLSAAEPLLQRRADQGLATRAVAFEEIADAFGHGRPSAEAVRDFLAFAFQSWSRPSPRYVLLLGDASYDPRNFTGAARPSPLPVLWTKTSYLWTASDPLLAAVNGEDALPDLAIGRLPAATVEEAGRLVAKLVAWEESGQGLAGRAALVADNPDLGGDFEADVRDVAQSFLSDRNPRLLLLSELGAGARPAIQAALDSGLGLLSYVGHGGAAVWASENVWNSWDAASLQAQSRQPLLLTLNCLNGYFVAPAFDSLAESLVKADGRGAIAAVSPSGLSLDGPAHQYHRALVAEIASGRHARLGDAVLAAQRAYAETGLMPELLSVYHLFGDPATSLR